MFCAESNSKAALSSCQNIPSWNPFHYSLGVDGMIPTVAVEQAPSNSPCLYLEEWPRLPFTARIDRAHSDRARSASKKGTWPLPSHPSEAARSASTFLAVMPLILTPSQVSQPGQSRLRPSNEHCFIVRVPGAKGCPGCEAVPRCHADKIFSVFSFSQLVAGWKRETSSARVEQYI
jgi:hypothetical protein